VLLFQDEARFGRITEGQRRCWAPFPQRPHAARQIVRQYLYAVAAVSPLDGRLCSLILPWMDAQTMAIFLRFTARTFAAEHCVMFLDQAGWHTATTLRVPRSLTLCKLPARSPELNPVESLWKHIRENYFGQTVIASLQEVETRLCQAFRALDEHPEVVKSLCSYGWIEAPSAASPPIDSPEIHR
jgi:putative transposase